MKILNRIGWLVAPFRTIVIWLVIGSIVGVPLLLVIDTIAQIADSRRVRGRTFVPSTSGIMFANVAEKPPQVHATLSLVITHVDVESLSCTVVGWLTVPVQLGEAVDDKGKPVFATKENGDLILPSGKLELPLEVLFLSAFPDQPRRQVQRVVVPLPLPLDPELKHFDLAGDDGVRLPMIGSSILYPNDTFSSALFVDVQLPSGMYFGKQDRFGSDRLPLDVELAIAPSAGAFTGEVAVDSSPNDQRVVAFSLRRPWSVRYTVDVVLGSVMIVVFVIILSKRRWGRSREDQTSTILTLAAIALALLPLRSVLVPASITQLTFVDYFLLLTLTIVIAMVFYTSVRRPSSD